MDSKEHLLRVERLASEAAALPAGERDAFVARACAGEAALADAVRHRLMSDAAATADLPVSGASAGLEAAVAARAPGRFEEQVGSYRILSLLGEGGFGYVYLAEQTAPVRRRVALKVIKPGMDTDAVLARFDAERQALALMDHPCIAKVFDAGQTESGRPYFVMELVEGMPFTKFCDRQKMNLAERIELFQQVCGAVQHAHQKGVIHRDLKPSNILVRYEGDRPSPKVIDFGVAKALNQRLTEQTIFTEQGQLIGTPEYMSPEQAEMSALNVDTRSDVYSLGVLLYELLTGRLPFETSELRRAGLAEIQRIIREVDPPKPSTRVSTQIKSRREADSDITAIANARRTQARELPRKMRGDLDWIVMRAMEKERTRRYPTADALAEDLRRYLCDEPVMAGPPSAAYRLRKFARRNRGAVAAAASVGLALTLGAVASAVLAVRASAARDAAVAANEEAQRQERFATSLNSFLLSTIEAPAVDNLGPTVSLRDALVAGESNLAAADREDARVGVALRLSYGVAYRALGAQEDGARILRDALARAQGLGSDAEGLERRIRSVLGQLLLEMGMHREMLGVVGEDGWSQLSGMFHDFGDYEMAEFVLRRNLDRLLASDPVEEERVAAASDLLARLLIDAGLTGEAASLIDRSLEIRLRVHGRASRSFQYGQLTRAYMLSAAGDWDGAREIYAEALAYYRALSGEGGSPMTTIMEMEHAGALEDDPARRGAPAPDAAMIEALGGLRPVAAIQLRNRGRLLARQGRLEEGGDRIERAVAAARSLGSRVDAAVTSESHTRRIWAALLLEAGRAEEGLAEIDASIGLSQSRFVGDLAEHLAPSHLERARILASMQRVDEAEREAGIAVSLREMGLAQGEWPEHSARLVQARLALLAGDRARAAVLLEQAAGPLRAAWRLGDPRRSALEAFALEVAAAGS